MENLRQFLPRGCANLVANETKFTVNQVMNVIYGRSKNEVILLCLLRKAKERKRYLEAVQEEKSDVLGVSIP